ncbi:conserved hypothetical protein [Planktothrix serta PCC 8927]|uniref:Endonuclease GajA/Old nuclease/RecF-like AAA domain-containing protein n=1 Tax=Planktothrix serta PCC 8927 TaxID=671068 RepID=A0A7Z9BM91_9CYAN|nr:AAA family ATPase [Planktothrix serta]VXD11694.1 conserved hypothetical protein [Planktothrix serta PCC 8927]
MKIKIKNLGIIEQAEINLKPLTVFIGENNTGKTWTAYLLAAIFGVEAYKEYLETQLDLKNEVNYPPLETAVKQLIEEGNAQLDLVNFSQEYLEKYINGVADLAASLMNEFMCSQRISFDNLDVKIELGKSANHYFAKIGNAAIESKISASKRSKKGLLNAVKESNNNRVYFYSGNESDILQKLPEKVIREFIYEVVFQTIHRSFYGYTYPFPTERTTFITLPLFNKIQKEKVFTVADANEITNDLKNETPINAVQRFIFTMLTASQKNFTEREKEIKDKPKIQKYINLAKLLEQDILKGKVDFEPSELRRELLFQTSNEMKLEMPIVSSMVKELAPLVLCLRYLVEPDEWLIIDEPEMNLHPSAQVEMIEFLAMLVQAGLNVLITTHSPYIVDHLSNLMRAAKRDDQEAIKERFYLGNIEAFISQEKVGVYLFKDRTAKNILNEEGFIDWETFSNVSDDISHIFS